MLNKKERLRQEKKKFKKLLTLHNHDLIYWDVGDINESKGYWKPKSHKTKKKIKNLSKRCIRASEKMQLKNSVDECCGQEKGNKYKRKYDYDWTLY